jgi:hypothetical protein
MNFQSGTPLIAHYRPPMTEQQKLEPLPVFDARFWRFDEAGP